MPQLSLTDDRVPTSLQWRYYWSPLHPMAPCSLDLTVCAADSTVMASSHATVPPGFTGEAIESLVVDSWRGYIYGSPAQAAIAMELARKRWWDHAKGLDT
jgi:hypothetical protein